MPGFNESFYSLNLKDAAFVVDLKKECNESIERLKVLQFSSIF
jgi:hypothetical protein